jgi:hypothetical protein
MGKHGKRIPATFQTRTQLISGMVFCVGMIWANSHLRTPVALRRFGSHYCEIHVGSLRTTLRGHGRWGFWQSAEAAISPSPRFVVELDLRPRYASLNRA